MRMTNKKPELAKAAANSPVGYISAEQRRAEGKALRDDTPRASHGGWKPPKDRPDLIELHARV